MSNDNIGIIHDNETTYLRVRCCIYYYIRSRLDQYSAY